MVSIGLSRVKRISSRDKDYDNDELRLGFVYFSTCEIQVYLIKSALCVNRSNFECISQNYVFTTTSHCHSSPPPPSAPIDLIITTRKIRARMKITKRL